MTAPETGQLTCLLPQTSDVVGWMWKRGGSKEKSKLDLVLEGRRKNWSHRWFVVEGTNLLYYVSPDDRQLGIPPKGKVVLNDFLIQRGGTESVAGCAKPSFMLASSTREFLLACDTEEERGQWMQNLQSILDRVSGISWSHCPVLDCAALIQRCVYR